MRNIIVVDSSLVIIIGKVNNCLADYITAMLEMFIKNVMSNEVI